MPARDFQTTIARRSRSTHHARRLTVCLAAGWLGAQVFAADVDPSRLPPPAEMKIDFDRDVRPIFENSCWRCHGPEKPKSHFRLDNRDSALKGGDNNAHDLVPGDSARSPLIHYVAGLVDDFRMPPPGKGDPLTPAQVGVLRAWIDQGAAWGAGERFPRSAFSLSPTLRFVSVDGDQKKFREIEGFKEGLGGGAENFFLQEQLSPDERVTAEGRALFPEQDVRVTLALEKTGLGFVRAGFESWRKYYDDTGGFLPPASSPDLNRDLHVDNRRAWFDVGLALPDGPRVVLGYEYQVKAGEKSMLDWGYLNGRDTFPASKAIDEQTHIVKLDVAHDFRGWHFEDSARVEFYAEKNRGTENLNFGGGPNPDAFTRTYDSYHHVQGMNTVLLEKPVRDWWFLSGGYFYSRLEASDFFNQTNSDASNTPFLVWNSERITLRRESHVFSVASIFTPAEQLSLSLGTQNEWTREEGFGNVPDLGLAIPGAPLPPDRASLDKFKSMQNATLRFTRIPFTVLFADARFEQENIGELQQAAGASPDAFLRQTDATNERRDLRAGFNTSPWRWLALSAHYRNFASDTDYDHFVDQSFTNGFFPSGNGYPAFILGRKIRTDEVEAKLTLRPASWLKTTLTYRLTATDYSTKTDPAFGFDPLANVVAVSPGGTILAGNYDAQTYGINAVLMPFRRFYLSGTFTYSQSRTITADHGSASIVPYEGGTYSAMASANYSLNPRTDLQAAWSFSHADFSNRGLDSVPLGLNYTRHTVSAGITRRWTNRLSSNVRYTYYRYAEPGTGGFNDFTAHGVFMTLALNWP